MYNHKKVTAILLAGGSGTRFGADRNKVYTQICGRPILSYSLEILTTHPYVDECILVVKRGEEETGEAMAAEALAGREAEAAAVSLTFGGATRQESVYNGLEKASGEIVVIHDGARPMIRSSYVTRLVETMDRVPGASMAVKSKDTIKLTDDSGLVLTTTIRANTWVVQTPQCFRTAVLKDAHVRFRTAPGITDDCSLLELAGDPVQMVEGDYTNIKVTTPEDRELAEAFLKERN